MNMYEALFTEYFELCKVNNPQDNATLQNLKTKIISILLAISYKRIKEKHFCREENIDFGDYYNQAVDTILYCLHNYDMERKPSFMMFFNSIFKKRVVGSKQHYIDNEKKEKVLVLSLNDEHGNSKLREIPDKMSIEKYAVPGLYVQIAMILKDFENFAKSVTKANQTYCIIFYTLETSQAIREDEQTMSNVILYEEDVLPVLDLDFLDFLFVEKCRKIGTIVSAEIKKHLEGALRQHCVAQYKSVSDAYVSKKHKQYYEILKSSLVQ